MRPSATKPFLWSLPRVFLLIQSLTTTEFVAGILCEIGSRTQVHRRKKSKLGLRENTRNCVKSTIRAGEPTALALI